MKTMLRHALCAALLSASAAQATTYNFSYTFNNGVVFNGSFDGTAAGNLITDISNIQAFRNGIVFAPQWGSSHLYDLSSTYSGSVSNAAVVSFDGTANDFTFSTSSYQIGGGMYQGFVFEMTATRTYLQGGRNADGSPIYGFKSAFGETANYSAGRWSVSAVPEPATYGMLLGGLGLVGLLARRRRAV